MPKTIKKVQYLMRYPEVSRWITRVMQRTNSLGTKIGYLHHLKYFLDFSGKTPSQLAKTPVEQIEDLMYEYDEQLRERDLASKSRALAWNTLRSFFKANRILVNAKFAGRIQVKTQDRAPSKQELRSLLDALDIRGKAVAALAAFAGLRLDTITKLTYGAIKKDYEEGRVPLKVNVEPEATKGGIRYFSFLSSEGIEYLKLNLKNRASKPSDPLIQSKKGKSPGLSHSDFASRILYRAMVKAGLTSHEWTPYDLRKYFKTRLTAGGMREGWTERLMGHVAGIHQTYDVPTEDELRAAYLKASGELDTRVNVMDEETVRKQTLLTMAESMGLKVRIEKAKDLDEVQSEIQGQIRKLTTQTFKEKKPEQKAIHERELERHLAKGWRFVSALNNGSGKLIVEKL